MFTFKTSNEELEKQGLYRKLETTTGIDFSSNDYLGMSKNSFIKKELLSFFKSTDVLGSTSSRLIKGESSLFKDTEEYLASFLDREASLIFNSGHSANEGVISAIGKDAIIFSDELNHASIIDGIRLSKSKYEIFKHNDISSLEEKLKKYPIHTKKIIVTESLFSMDGDFAPLGGISELADKYQSLVIIDEAHATGIYGKDGRGLHANFKFRPDQLISIHTGGKSLGAFGAFIGCTLEMKKFLINHSRQFIYTTALPPIIIKHLQIVLEYLKNNPAIKDQLLSRSAYAKLKLDKIGLNSLADSHILPLILPGNRNVVDLKNDLKAKGFDISSIRYPTVRKGQERIRISIHAFNTLEEIDALEAHLKNSIGELYE